MINTNTWNKIRYTIHSVYYDLIASVLNREREKAIKLLSPKPHSSILIVGAGTGLDLPYLKENHNITATDITPAMIGMLNLRAKRLKLKVNSSVMDGQNLSFEDNSFDYVILNLIVAVIPDPYKCIKEVERVVKDGGEILIFDKFLDDKKSASLSRKFLNGFTSTFFSNINRQLADIISVTKLRIDRSESSILNGLFQIVVLKKKL